MNLFLFVLEKFTFYDLIFSIIQLYDTFQTV